ncbi:MAG: IS110 family RNA-guided transposase [Planctomycetota bacterium]|jgi:transposase
MSNSKSRNANYKLKKAFERGEELFIGVDCHKRSYSVAVNQSGLLVTRWTMPRNHKEFIKKFEPYKSLISLVVYEAGPTGYSFYRDLDKAGYPVKVAAPGKTLKSGSGEPKTDHIDCAKLAEHACKKILSYIEVPTEEEEDDRQLVRLRDHLKKKRKRIKQQIKSFLLQHGIEEPKGLSHWTIASVNELEKIDLMPGLRFTLDAFLDQHKYFNERLKELEKEFKRIEQKHKKKMEIVSSHPGVGPVTSRKFVVEFFRPERFKNEKAVARFLGLAPNIHGSGETVKKKGVIPAGLAILRCSLIEAAWAWKRIDVEAQRIYNRLLGNSGKAQIAIVGVARRLGVHLWKMLVTETMYNKQKQALN